MTFRSPPGSELIERVPGDQANGVDPRQRYRVDATADQIMAFFDAEMPKAGWSADPVVSETSRLYEKGRLALGVMTKREGGTFTPMGS